MNKSIKKIIIVGGGTSGWMTATYLKKAFKNIEISLVESTNISNIGVGEATIPNLQKVFFDFLEIKEDEWMPYCNASFKTAIKFINWNDKNNSKDYFYHMFGHIPNIKDISLTHYWNYLRKEKKISRPLAYSCYSQALLLDNNLSPKQLNGKKEMIYAWHFDTHLVVEFLKKLALKWGIKHIKDDIINGNINTKNGFIDELISQNNNSYKADFFIDCSGFEGVLINQLLNEPFTDLRNQLLCNSAVVTSCIHKDNIIEPYTSSIAMTSGWAWKIPLKNKLSLGYVFSDDFSSKEDATQKFIKTFNLKNENIKHIKFKTGINKQSWSKNCVAIGLSSCFLEPLESTGLYFIYSSLYQLVKYFPDVDMNSYLRDSYNKEIEKMFNHSKDFVQSHYLLSNRLDSDFWKANKNLYVSKSLMEKIDLYKEALDINPHISCTGGYYDIINNQLSNFWTHTNYYSIFSGLKYYPNRINSKIIYDDSLLKEALKYFENLEKKEKKLLLMLPKHKEYLDNLGNV